ncbi:TetR/AcrR family transcriptional regulator [Solidesulfovibrio sp.]|uniref:TetR/AcrR family transcriptional regulator n=1 Tax=Solidesulfovibrio sp. TaxID=2910990 RepID=UPI0026088C57|nr:TetR/AcrR family transcriptional regulator [Solidesulfovibrio sp.]
MHEGTKERIVATAAAIMHRKGFLGTGLKEILDEAGVPKGSFYHHFKSKEDLGLAVVEFQAARLRARMEVCLGDAGLSPLARLRHLFETLREDFVGAGFRLGCPIGNLAQEMGDLSEPFRLRLAASLDRLAGWLAGHLEAGQRAGEIDPDLDSAQAARFLLASWQGALTCMKASGDARPLDTFLHFTFALLTRHTAGAIGGARKE